MSAALFFAVFGDDQPGTSPGRSPRPGVRASRDTAAPSTAPGSQPAARAIVLPGDIVARIRARDPRAVELLVDSAFDQLVRFAYGFVRAYDTAEDVVQDVFVRLWSNGATLRPDTQLVPYLYTAVRNGALNALRARATESRARARIEAEASSIREEWELSSDASPEQRLHWGELMGAFDRAITELTERQRSALLLRFEQGRTVPEIATILGISIKAAEKLVSRGVRELRTRLRDAIG